jgi:hypothetical protein
MCTVTTTIQNAQRSEETDCSHALVRFFHLRNFIWTRNKLLPSDAGLFQGPIILTLTTLPQPDQNDRARSRCWPLVFLLAMISSESRGLLQNYVPLIITQKGAEGTCRHLGIPIEKLQTRARPQPMIAPAIFLHVGKAGGGSIEHRAATKWNIALCRCHPDPCPHLVDGSSHYLINVRDPIDRFVSIFQWRMIVLCHPNGDDQRIPVVEGAFQDTEHLCEMAMPHNQEEVRTLFDTYQGDVNRLAESLCPATAASLDAEPDLVLIRHTPTLRDWLGTDWLDFHTKLFPIILDRSVDMEQQVDDAIVWLYNETRFETQEEFDGRTDQAFQCHNELSAAEDAVAAAAAAVVDHRHSSGLHPPLTKDAERCLARLFENDYRIMKDMVDKRVCKTDACSTGLSSILQRRSTLLSDDVETPASRSFLSFMSKLVSQFV